MRRASRPLSCDPGPGESRTPSAVALSGSRLWLRHVTLLLPSCPCTHGTWGSKEAGGPRGSEVPSRGPASSRTFGPFPGLTPQSRLEGRKRGLCPNNDDTDAQMAPSCWSIEAESTENKHRLQSLVAPRGGRSPRCHVLCAPPPPPPPPCTRPPSCHTGCDPTWPAGHPWSPEGRAWGT